MAHDPHPRDSYDPRTWPRPVHVDPPRAFGRRRPGGGWLWLACAGLLLGGAAASWLTRVPPGAPAAIEAQG